MRKKLLLLCIPLLLGGCAEENHLPVEADRIALQPSVTTTAAAHPADSRSIVNNVGTAADQINTVGIYVALASDNTIYPGTSATGMVFTAPNTVGQAWTSSTPVYVYGMAGRLFAWSPSGQTVTNKAPDAPTIPVGSIAAAQTFNGANTYDCSVTDYMYGAGTSTLGSKEAISVSNVAFRPDIYMQHALAQVAFRMVNAADRPADAVYDYVKKITLTANSSATPFKIVGSGGTMSLADGAFTGQSNVSELSFAPSANPKQVGVVGSPVTVAYGLVVPKAEATGTTVKLSLLLGEAALNNTSTERLLTIETDKFSGAWEKGNRYVYTLTLGKRGITISNAQIETWGKAESAGNMPPVMD